MVHSSFVQIADYYKIVIAMLNQIADNVQMQYY